MGTGGFLLRGGALALSWGGLTREERRDGGSRRARDVKRDGGIKIRTPTPNNSDNEHTLLEIEGGPSGTMNSARIMAIQQFACLPLPTPPKANNALPHSTHAPHTPQNLVSPIIWVGKHDPAVHHCPRCFRRQASPPHSHPHHFCSIPIPTAQPPPTHPHYPCFRCPRIQRRGPFSPGTTPSPSNRHRHLPGPLLHPTSTLSRSTTPKPLV
ncbi:hypothetical protein EDD85DRAFT_956464 [Armillaria nabsnona]|nr:hypothetical protein EDD85DRAFT_956464 [Armillaria nabsnona]